MSRLPRRLAGASALVVALIALLGAPAFSHETRQVGAYSVAVGWSHEPTYAGVENGVQIFIHDATGAPVDDLGTPTSLKVQVVYGRPDQPLPRPDAVVGPRHRPGHPRRVGRGHHADPARRVHVPLHRFDQRPGRRPEVHRVGHHLRGGRGPDRRSSSPPRHRPWPPWPPPRRAAEPRVAAAQSAADSAKSSVSTAADPVDRGPGHCVVAVVVALVMGLTSTRTTT